MTKKCFRYLFCMAVFLPELLLAQSPSRLIAQGNKSYEERNYTGAETYYRQAIKADPQNEFPQAIFNLGNALFMQKKFDEAAKQFQQMIDLKQKSTYTAQAYFNLGNCLLAQKKLPQSAEAYKKSLLLNSKDNDARYNLSLAMALMNRGTSSAPVATSQPAPENNLPPERPLSDQEMKNLLNQLNHEENQTLDSMKRRTFSRRQKKDW